MESPREIQLQISSRSISEGNSERHPLPYPIGCQKFTMGNSHIVHTPAALPEHPISYPIFILMDFFGSFQSEKRSKMMLLTLETDFFGSFQDFFAKNKMTESRATEQKKNWFCIRHSAGIWIFLFFTSK